MADPNTTPPRQSIEIRAIAFFPDHHENTIPDYLVHSGSDNELVQTVVDDIINSIHYADKWEIKGKIWMI